MKRRTLLAWVAGLATLVMVIFLNNTATLADHHLTEEATPEAESETPKPVKKSSGLIYTELKAGTGKSPKRSDKVSVHYHGTFQDGRVFDSSVERGKPTSFPLTGVIKCWTEGLQLMKVGGKAKLECPPEIAYGKRGRPPKIPGNSTLNFDVELLAIQ